MKIRLRSSTVDHTRPITNFHQRGLHCEGFVWEKCELELFGGQDAAVLECPAEDLVVEILRWKPLLVLLVRLSCGGKYRVPCPGQGARRHRGFLGVGTLLVDARNIRFKVFDS